MPTLASRASGLCAARLAPGEYAARFSDAHPPLTRAQALIEAERCYDCFDAPCTRACPTEIDVPAFIQRIAQDNLRGAARAILSANPLGGTCARVCPTEVLCEQACVRNALQEKPVEIGRLQRYATDAYFAAQQPERADPWGAPLFERAAPTGRRVAVVGAGPAGLACAHGLALRGHEVVLFEARPKPGGLNEYGLARYKVTSEFVQQEVRWLLSVGGIELRCGQQLGRDFTLDGLLAAYDAVFLGLGLAGVNALSIAEPQAQGLRNAVDFIAEIRQAQDLSRVPVGRRVLVLGGGMTAVDAAVQARMLGAEEVSIVYRRGPESMPASAAEQQWAQTQGVLLRHWAAPQELLCADGQVRGLRCAVTTLQDGRLVETGETFTLEADMVLKAIGQSYVPEPAGAAIALQGGRIATDVQGRTSVARVWAGGARLAAETGLAIDITLVSSYPAQPFHPECTAAVARAAQQLGYAHMPAVSGAGHDAVYLARLAPAGMIFIPCKDGISHNEIESATPEHVTAGCNVLLHAMLERAGIA